jgi:hypothetical protein
MTVFERVFTAAFIMIIEEKADRVCADGSRGLG